MKTIVISNQSQFDRFFEGGHRTEDFSIYCDNLTFSPTLRSRGIRFSELSEYIVQDHWEKANAWGCGAAAAWVRFSRSSPQKLDYDFPSILYLFFSHLLVHMIKNFLYARWLIDTVKPERVLAFDDKTPKEYPAFSGNLFLNLFLTQSASRKKIPLEIIPESPAAVRATASAGLSFSSKLLTFFRRVCQNMNSLFFFNKKARGIWVYGSLRHAGPVLLIFKERGIPFFLYDRHFNFMQFFFARWNNIPYITPSTKMMTVASAREEFTARHSEAIRNSFEDASKMGVFVYEGVDFTPFIHEHILSGIGSFLQGMAESEAEYQAVLKTFRVDALLSEEDYARRGGFLAAFLKRAGVPVFCISHSATAADFAVKKELCCIGQSTTFVNSDFERDAYVARGWDPEALVKTGIPRYDSLISRAKIHHRRSADPLCLLFCASLFVLNYDNPDRLGYLGHMLYAMSETVKPTADLFFETIKCMRDVKVILKPHGLMGLNEWKDLVAKNNVRDCVKIIRTKVDINKFFATSDAMIVSYWSTALIEAALFGLPIIFLDFTQTARPSVEKFAKAGFCKIVRNTQELRETLLQLRERGSDILPPKNQSNIAYFLGSHDGHATMCVADFIQTELARRRGEK